MSVSLTLQFVFSKQKYAESSQSNKVICDALRDLVALVQFEKREKHSWRSANFSKVAG